MDAGDCDVGCRREAGAGRSRGGHPALDRGGPGAGGPAPAWTQRLTPHLAGDLAPAPGPADPDTGPAGPWNVQPPGRSLYARLERDPGRAFGRAPRLAQPRCRRPLVWRRGRSVAAVEMPLPDSTPGLAVLGRSGAGGLSVVEACLRTVLDRSLRPALDGPDRRLRLGPGHHQ